MSNLEEPLSERERDVLNCLVRGASNREIAQELTISPNTVKVHVRNIFAKLGVSSRTEATTVALQQGLVTLPGIDGANNAAALAGDEVLDDEAVAPSPATTAVPDSGAPPATAVTAAPPPARRRNSRTIAGLVVVLLALLLGVTAALQWRRWGNSATPGQATAATAAFVAQPFDDARWLESRAMPGPYSHMAVAGVGLQLYQIGGETNAGITDTVYIYETDSHDWRAAAPKLTAVADVMAAVLFGEIYVPGGRTVSGAPTAVVEVYSPANNAWRRAGALPRPIAGGITLGDGTFLYHFGGWDGRDYLADSYVYDPGSDGWRPLPPMSRPRAFAVGGALANGLYVVGGWDGQQELADCEYYEPLREVWTACPEMLLPRGGAGAAVLFNKLYVIGGGLNGAVGYGEVYDPANRTWQVVNVPMLADAPHWTYLGVATVERQIYLLGGRQAENVLDNTFVYIPFPFQSFIPAASSGGE